MKRLELPHQLADYLCPVNGLCDVYEWKTGKRIPEELIFYSKAGFQMISQKRTCNTLTPVHAHHTALVRQTLHLYICQIPITVKNMPAAGMGRNKASLRYPAQILKPIII